MAGIAVATRRVAVGLLLSLAGASAALAAPPVEAFGTVPDTSAVHLSPDGQHIAAIQPVNGRPQAVVFEFTPTGVKRYVLEIPEAIARNVLWAGNDRLIAIYSKNEKRRYDTQTRMWMRAFSMNAHMQDIVRLMGHSVIGGINVNAAYIADLAMNDPENVYMEGWNVRFGSLDTRLGSEHDTIDVFRVNLKTGDPTDVAGGGDNTVQWVLDGHGGVVARADDSQVTSKEELMLGGPGAWKTVATYDAIGGRENYVHGLDESGKSLAIERVDEHGTVGLYPFGMTSHEFGQPLFADPQYDIEGAMVDDWTRRVVGVHYASDKEEYRYFDPKMESLQRKLEDVLPGQSVDIVSSDISGDTDIILSDGPKHPPVYQIFRPGLMQLSTLTPQYPHLTSADLGEVKPYPYKARDGQQIHAYLTLPPGRDPHNLPAVVFPHGGPEARDVMGFDWWAQFMASRGYAVLQPNFRGSTGYGIAFRDAGRGQWGRRSQDDISDGVKQMIADGIADPKRICIVGASYGGYAALAGATFTPDLYACAISYAGISDVPALIGYVSQGRSDDKILEASLNAEIGNVFGGEAALKDVSPGLHADRVRAPVLLLHSDNDVTVPIVQSEIELHALQAQGKNVQMITLKGDDHYLGLTETRVALLKAVESFLDANIGH